MQCPVYIGLHAWQKKPVQILFPPLEIMPLNDITYTATQVVINYKNSAHMLLK